MLKSMMKMLRNYVLQFFFITGIVLLLLNSIGLFTSLRSPDLYMLDAGVRNDITLSQQQLDQVIRSDISDIRTYVTALNFAINRGTANYWDDRGIDQFHLRVPLQENYLLYLASYVRPETFLKYEFMDHIRAIERGVGLCSQHSIILVEVLRERGIEAKMIGLSGHVVATVRVDNQKDEWWVLDPLYGVIIPYSLDQIEKSPEIIEAYYRDQGYHKATLDELNKIFRKDGNIMMEHTGAKSYAPTRYMVEKLAYIIIWIVPVLIMLPFLFRQNRNSRPA